MSVYIENPKDTTRKLLELINEFINVAGYKLMCRNLLHFYTQAANPTYHHIKKNKISRKKHTQEDKRAVLQKL